MRTTVNLDEALLAEVKERAARQGRPPGAVIDDALRVAFAEPRAPERPRRVELPTDGGSGLRPGVDLEERDRLTDLLDAE